MPKSFKVSLIFCGIALVFGLVSGFELGLRVFDVWHSRSFFRFSGLFTFFSLALATLVNTWSFISCLRINEPAYAVKNFLLYFFPIGALWLLLAFIGASV